MPTSHLFFSLLLPHLLPLLSSRTSLCPLFCPFFLFFQKNFPCEPCWRLGFRPIVYNHHHHHYHHRHAWSLVVKHCFPCLGKPSRGDQTWGSLSLGMALGFKIHMSIPGPSLLPVCHLRCKLSVAAVPATCCHLISSCVAMLFSSFGPSWTLILKGFYHNDTKVTRAYNKIKTDFIVNVYLFLFEKQVNSTVKNSLKL